MRWMCFFVVVSACVAACGGGSSSGEQPPSTEGSAAGNPGSAGGSSPAGRAGATGSSVGGAAGSSGCQPATLSSTPAVASSAAAAWPNRTNPAAPVTREAIVTACASWASCTQAPWASPDRLYLVQVCVDGTLQSLERAIPMVWATSSTAFVETAEFFVTCIAASSCEAADACLTSLASGPPPFAYCQEDGCAPLDASSVSCDGATATIARPDCTSLHRDCTRSSAACDATSPTGCTDRPLSRCETAAMGAPDRCDGDVRLGCDASGYVSWRDCARLQGGTCTTANGVADCNFGGSDCGPREVTMPTCAGHQLSICAYGKNVVLTSADVCP